MSLMQALKAQRHNVRDYGMYIAFIAIVIFFAIATEGLFVSSRNIGNLMNAMSYIAVLAVGMTLVIVIRHIDLSVGFLAGTLGAVAAISLKFWHLPVGLSILLVLLLGILAGLITAFLVAHMKIPAFVATLAGWLLYKGALQLVTRDTGTIIINSEIFNALGNGFIPDFNIPGFLPGVHKVTLLLGLVAILLFIRSEFSNRRKTQAYNFEVLPMSAFITKLIFISVVIAGITWVLAGYQGLSWATVILLFVVLVQENIAEMENATAMKLLELVLLIVIVKVEEAIQFIQ